MPPLCRLLLILATSSPVERVVDEGAIAHLPVAEQELVREYVKEWPRVVQFYQSMTFEGSISREDRVDDQSEYIVSSEFHGTAKILNNQMFRITGKAADGTMGMVIADATDVYGFGWNESKQSYFLASRFKSDSSFMNDYITQYAFHIETFDCGEFYRVVFGTPQHGNQTVTLDRVEIMHVDDEEVVRATVVRKGSNKGEEWCAIRVFDFLRNRSWARKAVHHAYLDIPNRTYKSLETIRCSYDGEVDGIPLLKECVREWGSAPFSDEELDRSRFFAPGIAVYRVRERATVNKFTPGPPDLAEFDAKPFLKAMGGLGRVKPTVWQPAFYFLNSLALLSIGVFLFRARKREKNDLSLDPAVASVNSPQNS
ncbi:MAG: hypothetical protein WCJ09_12790 [Planctomycetota bacterium]